MKNIRIFYLKIFNFLVVKFSMYLNRLVYVLHILKCCLPKFLPFLPSMQSEKDALCERIRIAT